MITDEGTKYLKGVLGAFWRPETEFFSVLGKIQIGRRTPGNPFHPDTKAVKSGKK